MNSKRGDFYVTLFPFCYSTGTFIFSIQEEGIVHYMSANPPMTCSASSSASSVLPKRCPPSHKRRNDDPLDEMHVKSITEMKEKRASKEPGSRNTHFVRKLLID